MGRENNIMNCYLAEPDRFADFFNGVCFEGEKVINPEGLMEASEKYDAALGENKDTGERTEKEERIRDIKKLYNGGSVLRVFALENQSYVDYTAGVRNMQYDVMEYAGQLKNLKAEHKEKNRFASRAISANELLSGISGTDRLRPAYTLWFYHGEGEWDGPRSLKDMMDFGDDADGLSTFFADYRMNLICLNEIEDFCIFHTQLRQLFKAMKCRKDKAGLRNLMNDNEEFRHLEPDTVEAMSIMLHMPEIWKNRENYMSMNEEREEYDMCQAMREICEEERNIGFSQGIDQGIGQGIDQEKEHGIKVLIRTCKKHNVTKNETVKSLKEEYGYNTDDEAMEKINLYW